MLQAPPWIKKTFLHAERASSMRQQRLSTIIFWRVVSMQYMLHLRGHSCLSWTLKKMVDELWLIGADAFRHLLMLSQTLTDSACTSASSCYSCFPYSSDCSCPSALQPHALLPQLPSTAGQEELSMCSLFASLSIAASYKNGLSPFWR